MDRMLDLSFVNSHDDVQIIRNREITYNFPLNLNSHTDNNANIHYNFNKADFNSLNVFLCNVSWYNVFTNSCLNAIVESF